MVAQPHDLPRLAPRLADSHKGDYGRVLLLGGSRGMSGAIALAGMAALRAGAGLVTLGVPDPCLETVAAWDPCCMTVPLESDDAGRFAASAGLVMLELAARATVVGCGPGWGQHPGLVTLARTLYTRLRQPLVVDADALNALAQSPDALAGAGGQRIITPHPGEFRRLTGVAEGDAAGQQTRAMDLASAHGIVVVLKGHRTLVTDGQRTARNETGNPGMATAGAGDVLTGVLTALLGQGVPAWEAARLGVFAHGLAGDLAARQQTQLGMTARDLVQFLPEAWRALGY
ncbi:MAG: NAD(P)H-hydrate dehydratase [Pirellulaceae bacterium]|jgi:NAD(P)H-hydrate epimerase|nr:NAD(P)H-hydrate dehydratase [Pirellulaceae bacterium]